MRKHNRHICLLHSTRAVLVASLLLPAAASRAQAPQSPASNDIENVVHMVGFDDKPGGTGDLDFNSFDMTLYVHGHSTAIPLRSILAFSIVHDDKALISGSKGKIAEAMPYGVGFAVAMKRPPAETLTLFYRDSNYAIHGSVLVLPKDTGERVDSALASVGLSEAYYPKTGHLMLSEPQRNLESETASVSGLTKPSVEVALPSESIDGIPPAFAAAVYEDLIEQLTQSDIFAHVWRAGDSRRTPDALVLHLDVEDWKKGSARERGFGLFTGATAGATKIKSKVTLVDASGRTVFQGEVDGSKRTNGENLEVTNGLAKHVRKELEKAPDLKAYK